MSFLVTLNIRQEASLTRLNPFLHHLIIYLILVGFKPIKGLPSSFLQNQHRCEVRSNSQHAVDVRKTAALMLIIYSCWKHTCRVGKRGDGRGKEQQKWSDWVESEIMEKWWKIKSSLRAPTWEDSLITHRPSQYPNEAKKLDKIILETVHCSAAHWGRIPL